MQSPRFEMTIDGLTTYLLHFHSTICFDISTLDIYLWSYVWPNQILDKEIEVPRDLIKVHTKMTKMVGNLELSRLCTMPCLYDTFDIVLLVYNFDLKQTFSFNNQFDLEQWVVCNQIQKKRKKNLKREIFLSNQISNLSTLCPSIFLSISL